MGAKAARVSGKKGEARFHHCGWAEHREDWGAVHHFTFFLVLLVLIVGDSFFCFCNLVGICSLGSGICPCSETEPSSRMCVDCLHLSLHIQPVCVHAGAL